MADVPMLCVDLADNAFWEARDTLQRAVAERTTDPTRDVYERAYYELAAGRGLERRAYKSRMLAANWELKPPPYDPQTDTVSTIGR